MDFPRGIRSMRGRLQIRYTVDGKRYEETLDIAPSRSGVTEAARIRKERIQARRYGVSVTAMPFEQVAQDYLDRATVALSTRGGYKDSLNIYWSALKGRDVAAITVADLITLDDSIDWPSPQTRNNALVPLRQVFRFAVSRGFLLTNPADALGASKGAPKTPDPYTIAERDALLTALDATPAGEFFRVAFGTGARTGELIALRWEDFDGSSLHIQRARVRGALKGTKTGKPRRVLLQPETIAVLKAMPRPIHGGPIFVSQYGRGFQAAHPLNRIFRRAHKTAGVRLREGPYPWRSTYASIALSAGVKPSLIAAQLGHRVDMLLTVYARYIPRDDDAAELAKMSGLGKSWEQIKLEGA